MKGNLSFIHAATKKMETEGDIDQKDRVRRLLQQYFDLYALQDETLFFDKQTGHQAYLNQREYGSKEEIFKKFHVHNPDLIIKSHRIVVEIDGDWHWKGNGAVKKTNERNQHYEQAGYRILWLTDKEVLRPEAWDLVITLAFKLGMQVKHV